MNLELQKEINKNLGDIYDISLKHILELRDKDIEYINYLAIQIYRDLRRMCGDSTQNVVETREIDTKNVLEILETDTKLHNAIILLTQFMNLDYETVENILECINL